MILSKDSNTLNLTASILSAKSMLQTKLDEIGIDIRVIERNLDTLKTEVTELKKEVEETKEELVAAAEELKTKTDNERIKQKIDEVQTELDEVEIDDDFLDGLCLSHCFMVDGSCVVFCNLHDEPTGCTGCYGYSEPEEVCIAYDQPVCPGNQFTTSTSTCTQEYCKLAFTYGGGGCDNDYDFSHNPNLDCWQDYDEQEGLQNSQCLKGYNTTTIDCKNVYIVKVDGTAICTSGYTDKFGGDSCIKIYNITKEGVSCNGYESTGYGVSCEEGHEVLYDDQGFVGTSSCPKGYIDEENDVSCESDFFENNGVVSCKKSHSGDDGSCSEDHTWSDGIGGQCKGVFNNSQMNCQGGVASNEVEQQLLCDGDYTSGNINCAGGFAEDVDDHETFCPSNFSDGHTTCRQMYMKQNGVETCSNKDPISCRGGCVSGHCDYCGGCVGSCDSCRGCHGAGNCNYNVCEQCHGTTVTYTCGAQACGSYHDYCVSHGYGITCTGDY